MFHTKSLFPAISLVPQEQRTDQVFRATDFFQDISQNLLSYVLKENILCVQLRFLNILYIANHGIQPETT